MNFGMIRYVLGWVLLCESVLLLLPCAVSLYYGESALWALLLTVLLCALLGGAFLLVLTMMVGNQDYNGDGDVTTEDALMILRKAADLI